MASLCLLLADSGVRIPIGTFLALGTFSLENSEVSSPRPLFSIGAQQHFDNDYCPMIFTYFAFFELLMLAGVLNYFRVYLIKFNRKFWPIVLITKGEK